MVDRPGVCRGDVAEGVDSIRRRRRPVAISAGGRGGIPETGRPVFRVDVGDHTYGRGLAAAGYEDIGHTVLQYEQRRVS